MDRQKVLQVNRSTNCF